MLIQDKQSISQCPAIVFLTGASGVGKTSIVTMLSSRNTNPDHIFLHADSDGVPSFTEMVQQAGSLEKYQELSIHKLIEKITRSYQSPEIVIVEGQARLNFIEDACRRFGVTKYTVILIDCDWEIMRSRLIDDRQQPELATSDMRNWAKFLRKQAQQFSVPIIDTSQKPIEQIVDIIQSQILQRFVSKWSTPPSVPPC